MPTHLTPATNDLCLCGCGQPTEIAPRTHACDGWVKGQPKPFLSGHKKLTRVYYHVDPLTDCWVWQRSLNTDGYGLIQRGGKTRKAYRWYFEQANGPVPEGLELDHLCRNRACVNPAHLEPVSHATNGHRSSNTKLSAEQVREIRELHRKMSRAEIAARFGVTVSAIDHIWQGHTWKDIA